MTPTPHSTQTATILIVDDDPISALMLEGLLRNEGFQILKASSGPEGRVLAAERNPDLILLDVQMPEENGLVTCRNLQERADTAKIPVIFLTGSEDMETKLQGFEAGAVDYITKPYESAEVLARIRIHIRARRATELLAQAQMAQLGRLSQAQRSILVSPEDLPEARFAVFYRSFAEAGGDFYDVAPSGEGIFDYIVADVSGHDVDSSLVTSALKVLLVQGRSTLASPIDTLRTVNGVLRSTFQGRYFITLAWVRLNLRRLECSVLTAGHPPILILRSDGTVDSVDSAGDLLGILPGAHIEEVHVPVKGGDRIALFTDGLLELPKIDGTISLPEGTATLTRALHQRREAPLEAMVTGTAEALLQGCGGPRDDLLVLVLQV